MTQKHAPDRVRGAATTPQPLFGLAELWEVQDLATAQHRAHKFVKRSKEKSTAHAVYGVTAKSLHFFTSRDSMHNTHNSVFFPLVWVCYLFIPSFPFPVILFIHSFSTISQAAIGNVGDGGHGGPCEEHVWWGPQTRLGYCGSFRSIMNIQIQTRTLRGGKATVHVQFSSVTESNQLCHPRRKSPSGSQPRWE